MACKFNFTREKFEKLLFPSEALCDMSMRVFTWTQQDECEDRSETAYDGYLQSLEGKSEPILLMGLADPKLCEPYADRGVNFMGVILDSISRDLGGETKNFVQLVVGRDEGEEIFASFFPMVLDNETGPETTTIWPTRIAHFQLNRNAKRPCTYQGAWAIMDEDWDDAAEWIKHFKHHEEGVGEIQYDGEGILCAGDILVVKNPLPKGSTLSAKLAFEKLLITCKMNTLACLQKKHINTCAQEELTKARKEMESIYMGCVSKLQCMMLRKPESFEGMSLPLEDMYGLGMGYFGLVYSDKFVIVMEICKHLAIALGIIRDYFNENSSELNTEGYEVLPWNSKSQSSIFTKITDYAEVPTEPTILRSCGLLGIKDYIRTRLIVPPGASAQEKVEHYLNEYQERGVTLEDVVYKDKSFRFKPDGQAIYVTGYMVVPVGFAYDKIKKKVAEMDMEWPFYTCECIDGGNDLENGMWAMPFEIQAVNQAALDFINGAHHTYEIQRVAFRIAEVCKCSMSKGKDGRPLPQTQCANCQYRLSVGQGYCPFCHICFTSVTQKKNCTLSCCEGENVANDIDEKIKDMEAVDLRAKVKALEAELSMWRANFGNAAGSGSEAIKQLKK